jgi:polysaccharide export outer membrane protein
MKRLCCLALALAATSCTHGRSYLSERRFADCAAEEGDIGLGPGDIFEVRVFDEQQLSGTYRVAPDGMIAFPMIGDIYCAGRTPVQVGKLLEQKLAEGYLRTPQVFVSVKEIASKKVSVIGQVSKQGTFPFADRMTVIEAITQAGGFTAVAAKDDTVVTRFTDGNKRTLKVPVEAISEGRAANFCIRPGDIVFVPERIF